MSAPDLQTIVELAEEMGQLALRSLAAATLVGELKPDSTLVTRLDRELEQVLECRLSELYPDLGFLGEEYGFRGSSHERCWVVDPIDGTTNLVRGIPFWGIAIGLLEGEEATLGVFHMPLLSETFAAQLGEGATLNGVPLQPADKGVLEQEDTVVATSSALRALDLGGAQGRLRAFGSICAELCYAAAGRCAACISMGDKFTDLVAPLCICREAGLRFQWLSGSAFRFQDLEERRGKDALIVSPPDTLARMLGALGSRGAPG